MKANKQKLAISVVRIDWEFVGLLCFQQATTASNGSSARQKYGSF